MPNDMRDRLVELIQDIKLCNPTNWDKPKFMALALLANGVIISPCNVGDDIWIVKCYEGKPLGIVKDKVQMIGITSRGFHIKARDHHDHNKMYMLGKTVFITREDAEKALREREGE